MRNGGSPVGTFGVCFEALHMAVGKVMKRSWRCSLVGWLVEWGFYVVLVLTLLNLFQFDKVYNHSWDSDFVK